MRDMDTEGRPASEEVAESDLAPDPGDRFAGVVAAERVEYRSRGAVPRDVELDAVPQGEANTETADLRPPLLLPPHSVTELANQL